MANHRKHETSAKLKKFYSALSQAVRLAQIDNYNFMRDSYSEREYYKLDIWWNKYLSSLPVTKLENIKYTIDSPTAGGQKETFSNVYMLNDGSLIIPFFIYNGSLSLIYDVNGEKGPNYKGRDIFVFNIQQYDKTDEGIHWFKICGGTTCNYTPSLIKRTNDINSCKRGAIDYCTRLIQNDGWEIKNDYPIRI